jgi:hypothetical protein
MENKESILSVLSQQGLDNILTPQEALAIQAKLLGCAGKESRELFDGRQQLCSH